MVERVEIRDSDSAEAWLKTQDHQTQVWFATRCALRALPGLGHWQHLALIKLAFQSVRSTFIASAAATCSSAEMMTLERAAATAESATSFAASSASTNHDATVAVYSASAAAAASAATHSFDPSFASSAAARSAIAYVASAVWTAATADANVPKTWGKLWHDAPQPEGLVQSWQALKAQWEEDGPHWSFWIKWYEAVRDGTWTDWDLIYRIATELEEEDWDAGAERVAKRIAAIEAAQEVAKSASDVLESLDTVFTAETLPPRGHNNPPEMIDEPSLVEDVADLRRAVAVLEQQAKSDNPDKETAQEAVEDIERWHNRALKWLGRKLDLAVDTIIKWAIPAGGGYLILNPAQLHKLIDTGLKLLLKLLQLPH